MHFLRLLPRHSLNWIFLVAALAVVTPRAAHAEALLVVEADTGKVLQADNATMPWYPASVTKIMTAYVTLKAVKEGRLSLDTRADGVAGRGLAVAVQDGLPSGHSGHRRQRAEDDDGEVGQRHGRGARRRRRRIGRRLLGDDEPDRAEARHDADELRQSERPAGGRPDHFGARSRDPGARRDSRPAGIRILHAHSLDPLRPQGDAEFQQADRTLSGRRRLQDRLHLRFRLQSGRLRDAQRQAADRRRARRIVRARRARFARRNCWSAASAATGWAG